MFSGKMLKIYLPASELQLKEIITKSLNKSCDLNPLLTWLLKKCVDQFLPLITTTINRSMDESTIFVTSHHNPAVKEIWVG